MKETDLELEKIRLQKILAKHIEVLRVKNDFSQFSLSKDAEISQSYYCKFEAGNHNVSIWTLFKIAKAMNLKLKDLIPDDL